MKTYELVVPCHFGLEAVLKREIYDLGYEIGRVEDGRITFTGDEEAICRAIISGNQSASMGKLYPGKR